VARQKGSRVSYCLRHQDRPTETRCATCLKPICSECTLDAPEGNFCGAECHEKRVAYNERKESMAHQPKDSLGVKLVRWLVPWVVPVLLLCAVVYLWPKLPPQWRAPIEKVFTTSKK